MSVPLVGKVSGQPMLEIGIYMINIVLNFLGLQMYKECTKETPINKINILFKLSCNKRGKTGVGLLVGGA